MDRVKSWSSMNAYCRTTCDWSAHAINVRQRSRVTLCQMRLVELFYTVLTRTTGLILYPQQNNLFFFRLTHCLLMGEDYSKYLRFHLLVRKSNFNQLFSGERDSMFCVEFYSWDISTSVIQSGFRFQSNREVGPRSALHGHLVKQRAQNSLPRSTVHDAGCSTFSVQSNHSRRVVMETEDYAFPKSKAISFRSLSLRQYILGTCYGKSIRILVPGKPETRALALFDE